MSSIKNLSSVLLIFTVIDLVFFPRLTIPFSMPMSLVLAIAYIFFNGRIKFSMLIFSTFISLILLASILNGSSEYMVDNFKRAIQLVTSIIYFYFLILVIKNREVNYSLIRKILFFGVIYMFFLLFIFHASPEIYIKFINKIYPETRGDISSILLFMRFQYIFSDPNSYGYFICFFLALSLSSNGNDKYNIFMITSLGLLILSTQSRGAIIGYALLVTSFYCFCNKNSLIKKIFLASTVTLLLAFTLAENSNFSESIEAIDNRSDSEESVGGGRIDKYRFFIDNFNILPIGVGYSLEKDGAYFRPHSDIIRMNLSYGLIITLFALAFFFPRTKKELVIALPVLVGMSINTVVDDYRLLHLCLLVICLLRYDNKFKKSNRGEYDG